MGNSVNTILAYRTMRAIEKQAGPAPAAPAPPRPPTWRERFQAWVDRNVGA